MNSYFTISELCRSTEAIKHNIDNTPPPAAKNELCTLINRLLNPVRELWGGPIMVNSGFRCPTLNNLVKGKSTSQHVKGQAADITVGSPAKNKKLFDMIIKSGIAFDQLIDERNYSWLHISFNSSGNRRQILHL